MKKINRRIRYSKYLYEAIPYSDVKKYLQIDRSKYTQKRLDTIFNKLSKLKNATTSKRGDRVYIPFEIGKRTTKSNVQIEIENLLIDNGMELFDYSKGLALDNYGRKTKIGKLLRRLDRSLLQPFANDTSRVSNKIVNSYIVFSKHKYDIAGMSTNRRWSSCTNIYDGMNKRYIEMDIIEGSFIAYLVSSDDMNINNPIGRINIKPFINDTDGNDIVYFVDNVYDSGDIPVGFYKQITNILSIIQHTKIGQYELLKGMLCDTSKTKINIPSVIKTKEAVVQILKFFNISNYTINSDLSVDVEGDVDLSDKKLAHLPLMFNKISGNFDCGRNQLITLEGSPKEVGGDFKCHLNKLRTLEYAPKIVNGAFKCHLNNLKDLAHSPQYVGGAFHCYRNELISLIGAPEVTGGGFYCHRNNLKTLEGAPKIVYGDFWCHQNQVKFTKSDVLAVSDVKGSIR